MPAPCDGPRVFPRLASLLRGTGASFSAGAWEFAAARFTLRRRGNGVIV